MKSLSMILVVNIARYAGGAGSRQRKHQGGSCAIAKRPDWLREIKPQNDYDYAE